MWYTGPALWSKLGKIFKNGILSLEKIKVKRFPSNILRLKFSFVSFPKFLVFAKFSKKSLFYPILIDV